MKKIAFIIISCFLLTLISCKKDYLNNGWDLVKKIDFNKSFDDNSEIINEVLLNFKLSSKLLLKSILTRALMIIQKLLMKFYLIFVMLKI